MLFSTLEYRDFMNIETLKRKVGSRDIAAIIAKEVTDNSLDVCGHCHIGQIGENGFYVVDNGPGIDIEMLSKIFSINRELISSKKLRLPTRGALGNGLRVVVGSVYATGGQLIVSTRGKTFNMDIQDDGTTIANYMGEYEQSGTRVEVHFGSGLKVDLSLAQMAVDYAIGSDYKGKTSSHFYNSESFFELLKASSATIREVISEFDGCTGGKAGMITAPLKGRQANSVTFEESEALLNAVRMAAPIINPKRLGCIGEMDRLGYSIGEGCFNLDSVKGRHGAEIPFIVEAWAELDDMPNIQAMVNKSPITDNIWLFKREKALSISGCGLNHKFDAKPARVIMNINTSYMPITSDGKQPDFRPMVNVIAQTIQKAIKKATRFKPFENKPTAKVSEKDIIKGCLEVAISKASGNGEYRYSQRQLYYAVRPYVMNQLGKESEYSYFSSVITDIESIDGDLPGMYRDPRGVIYHPHLKTEIPLGTIAVEEYARPDWTFNKILYSEKEGFFPILKDTKWAERHDCALMTSKGYASRAVKDILDLLGETAEELLFFCIHDADAAGTMIYESLQEATKARPGRKVRIINLGLDPAEALQMGLEVENVKENKGRKAVASYLPVEWAEWLQDKRVELNAMPTPLFLTWLDKKMEQHGAGKLIPPDDILIDRLQADVRNDLRERITDKVLREAGINQLIEETYAELVPEINKQTTHIRDNVTAALHERPEGHWTAPVKLLSERIIELMA
jgi:hypothetical protein